MAHIFEQVIVHAMRPTQLKDEVMVAMHKPQANFMQENTR